MKRKLEGKGYVFRSDSDCEILLPLYAEYGLGMFRMLDAEFALVLYDARQVASYIGSDHREIYMTREDVFCALEQVIAALGTYATARASIFCAALSHRGGWLPDDILMREKAAFSDAVGHSMVDDLKAYAERAYGDDWRKRTERYAYHARPFTKESLLYREIFEKYYPGQARMVADFWMPNRDWKGCDVSDPSARALANYGDSGK